MNNDSTITYKKESWLRYGFWCIAIIFVIIAVWFFVGMFNQNFSSVPSGYKFSIEDHYAKNTSTWSTYYVYDTYVLVQDDSPEPSATPVVIYDGIDTSAFELDESDTTRTCDSDSCYEYPKVLAAVKKSIVGKPWREYTGR